MVACSVQPKWRTPSSLVYVDLSFPLHHTSRQHHLGTSKKDNDFSHGFFHGHENVVHDLVFDLSRLVWHALSVVHSFILLLCVLSSGYSAITMGTIHKPMFSNILCPLQWVSLNGLSIPLFSSNISIRDFLRTICSILIPSHPSKPILRG